MRLWLPLLLVGCVPALEDDCDPVDDPCGSGQLCLGGVCVSEPDAVASGDSAMPGPDDGVTPPDGGGEPPVDGGGAPDPDAAPVCPEGFGDADEDPENGCEHGCVVPGPRGQLVSDADAPQSGAALTLSMADSGAVLIGWTNPDGALHVWDDGQIKRLGADGPKLSNPSSMPFGGGWALAVVPEVLDVPRMVAFRITDDGFFQNRFEVVEPNPPAAALARLGQVGGEQAPAVFFIDERMVRSTGEWALKVGQIIEREGGPEVVRPRVVELFPEAVRIQVAAASSDRGVVVVFPEQGDAGNALRIVRVDPGGALEDSFRQPVDAPITQVSAVATPDGVLFGGIGDQRMYVGRVVYARGSEPVAFYEVETGDQPLHDLQMLSLQHGDAALLQVGDEATMILLAENNAVAWASPVVGPGDRYLALAGASGVAGLAVAWSRDEGESQLLWARPDCR